MALVRTGVEGFNICLSKWEKNERWLRKDQSKRDKSPSPADSINRSLTQIYFFVDIKSCIKKSDPLVALRRTLNKR